MDCINEITTQVTEEYDRFIFETIYPFCEENTKMVISKRILIRALECFKSEHADEYTMLMEEMKEK